MTLITKTDLKYELDIKDPKNDEVLELLALGVLNTFEGLTDRTFESQTFTEYHSCDRYQKSIFLKQRPVTSITSVHDDPDWVYGADSLVSDTEYTFSADSGILYSSGFWGSGRKNIKVVYVAGYTELPTRILRVLCQQGAHWFRLIKEGRWDLSSIAMPEGSGTMSFKNVDRGLLPQFMLLAELEAR